MAKAAGRNVRSTSIPDGLVCATSGRSLTIDQIELEQLFSANLYRSGRLDAPPFQPASARRNRMGKNTH
jgi:hypothetical protein